MHKMAATFFRVFGYMKPMQGYFLFGLFLSSFELLIQLATPEINRMLVQMVTTGEGGFIVWRMIFIMLGLLILAPLVAIGNYRQTICAQKTSDNLKKALFAHIQRSPISELTKHQSGDYLMRLTGDTNRAGFLFRGMLIAALMKFVVITAVSMTLLVLTDWRIAVFCLIYNLICFALASLLNPYVNRLERASRQEISYSSNILLEMMRALPIVRVFMIVPALAQRYRARCETVRIKRERYKAMSGVGYGVIDFFVFSSQAVGFIVAIFFLQRGDMALDSAVYTASLVALSADAMLQLSIFILWSQPVLVAAGRVFEILDEPCEVLHKPDTVSKPDKAATEALWLKNVSFSYPDGTTALQRINLVVPNGEKLALVGGSGGGKTTLAQIIASLYEPSEGNIIFYGADTSRLNLEDIRNFIAYVPQEPVLFEGSIYENIAVGMPDSSPEAVQKAAYDAGLEEFILSLPQGYETLVGERGTQISGGQRQRIAIARAILKNAPLLILDEASSALDSDMEAQVQQSLEQLSKGRTTITVAHRLSTIRNADRILVLEKGEIVEEGTHAVLMSKGGRYTELASRMADRSLAADSASNGRNEVIMQS